MRRRVLVLSVLLAALVAGLLSPAGPAQAAAVPGVRILSPADGAVVSGDVTARIEVTYPDGMAPGRLRVHLGTAGGFVDPPASCSNPCVYTTVLRTLEDSGPAPAGVGTRDGAAALQAWSVDLGQGHTAYRYLTVANGRPAPVVHAQDGAPVTSVRPFAESIDLVVRTDGRWPAVRVQQLGPQGRDLVQAADGTWPLTVDASGSDHRRVELVSTDAAGRTARGSVDVWPLRQPYTWLGSVDDTLRGGSPGRVVLSYGLPDAPGGGRPAKVTMSVDGGVAEELPTSVLSAPEGSPPQGALALHVPALEPGTRTLGFVLTDSAGLTSEPLLHEVTVHPRMTVEWVAPPPAQVVATGALPLSVRAALPGGKVTHVHVELDGQRLNTSRTCICTESTTYQLPVPLPRPGQHELEVSFEALYPDGARSEASVQHTFTVSPYQPSTPFVAIRPWASRGGMGLFSRLPDGTLGQYYVNRKAPLSLTPAYAVGGGWRSSRDITSVGDLDGDGAYDLLVRDAAGTLRRYEVTFTRNVPAFGSGVPVGRGWASFRDLHGPGDVTGDGRADLLARDAQGRLWLYAGDGAGGFAAAKLLGTGWGSVVRIITPDDITGDGRADLLTVDTAGRMWRYAGTGTGRFGRGVQVGTGWSAMNAVVGAGDINLDGRSDVYARDGAGKVWLYPGNGVGGFGRRGLVSLTWTWY